MNTSVATQTEAHRVGDIIGRLMAEQGRKAQWLAAEMGISYGTFRLIRRNQRDLTLPEADRLSKALGVSITTFLPEATDGQAT